MTRTEDPSEVTQLDTTDVDRYLGQSLGGGQLKEPVVVNDIRRWVQAMAYPNPIHYDEEAAAQSVFGRIVAPQSFTACCDVGHGARPGLVGNIPGSHMLFGGEEWWFSGIRIYPGDLLRMRRRFVDYRLTESKFAGPTMIAGGETVYINQRSEQVAKKWSTSIRYRVDLAHQKSSTEEPAAAPIWTDERMAEIEAQRGAWISGRSGANSPKLDELEVGQRLLTRPVGPHSLQTFATEWRAWTSSVWGTWYREGLDPADEAGWVEEMGWASEEKEDPQLRDGLYSGPARGHTDPEHAKKIGMPRGYGYGASMGAWVIDYVSAWAGDSGIVRHSDIQYRNPAFIGDLTLVDAEIAATRHDQTVGAPVVTLQVTMTNQDGLLIAKGPVEVQLPD